ncbi:MAG: DNA-binding response regulator [Parapedobacter sp.]|nr:MAG: DNA-binding response regulator [Parapedobacter sp.]
MNKQTIDIVVVDDHPVVLQGFSYMVQQLEGIVLKASFGTSEGILNYLLQNQADVILLDINLPDSNGIDTCVEILKTQPSCKVIAISNIDEYSIIQRMLDSGASGYLLKNASPEELSECIRLAMDGNLALSRQVEAIISRSDAGELPAVTRREKEVLSLLAQGQRTGEIAETLFVSIPTVESHRRSLLQKFQVANVAALIYKATEMKYL